MCRFPFKPHRCKLAPEADSTLARGSVAKTGATLSRPSWKYRSGKNPSQLQTVLRVLWNVVAVVVVLFFGTRAFHWTSLKKNELLDESILWFLVSIRKVSLSLGGIPGIYGFDPRLWPCRGSSLRLFPAKGVTDRQDESMSDGLRSWTTRGTSADQWVGPWVKPVFVWQIWLTFSWYYILSFWWWNVMLF